MTCWRTALTQGDMLKNTYSGVRCWRTALTPGDMLKNSTYTGARCWRTGLTSGDMLKTSTYSGWHTEDQHLVRHAEEQHLLWVPLVPSVLSSSQCWAMSMTIMRIPCRSRFACSQAWYWWKCVSTGYVHRGDWRFILHIYVYNVQSAAMLRCCFLSSSPFILYKGCIRQNASHQIDIWSLSIFSHNFRIQKYWKIDEWNEQFLGCKWCMHKQYSDLLGLQKNLKMEPFIVLGF